jgi:hypothetical protein
MAWVGDQPPDVIYDKKTGDRFLVHPNEDGKKGYFAVSETTKERVRVKSTRNKVGGKMFSCLNRTKQIDTRHDRPRLPHNQRATNSNIGRYARLTADEKERNKEKKRCEELEKKNKVAKAEISKMSGLVERAGPVKTTTQKNKP